MRRLIQHFWDAGTYGVPFKSDRSITQGAPLSAKLFNILIDTMVQEWHCILQSEMGAEDKEELDWMTVALFTIIEVDNALMAARDSGFLQHVLGILVDTITCVGPKTNISKTQAMTCTPGKIRIQLPVESYH